MNESDILVGKYCLNKEATRYFQIFGEKKDIKQSYSFEYEETYFRFESM